VDALEGGRAAIVVDLGDVKFMDSTALGVLVGVRRSLDAGVRLAVVCTHPDVLNIFQISGLDGAFDIFATRDEALAHVRGEEPRG
jgi:anti-sigma B factor antagonist